MIRAIIYDFNGVLVDDEMVHFALFRDVLAEQGVELTERDYLDEYLGYDDQGCFEIALSRAGQDANQQRVAELIRQKAERYIHAAESGLRFFPGAAEGVAAMADCWPVAVCSGALRAEIEYALDRLEIRDRVAAIIAAEDTTRCKPDPEGYFLALDALRSTLGPDFEAGHCLVVEDSLAGIQAAKAAGMWVVAVSHTYREPELRRAGADAVVVGIADVNPRWVRGFFAPEVSP